MSLPSIRNIISLYLYGKINPPSSADLLSDQWIRSKAIPAVPATATSPKIPAVTHGTTITLDQHEYMTIGPGRFATPEKFNLVNKFLDGNSTMPIGITSLNNIIDPDNKYGFIDNDAKSTVYQYVMGTFDADYAERAYVHGTTGFKITSGDFVVNIDGSREIRNLEIKSMNDNFDYDSINPIAQITNYLTKDQIDPSKIGRTVTIDFNKNTVGSVTELITKTTLNLLKEDHKSEDLLNDSFKVLSDKKDIVSAFKSFIQSSQDSLILPIYLPIKFLLAYQDIKNSGIINYIDNANHFIFFDGDDVSNNGVMTASELIKKIPQSSELLISAMVLH